MKTKMVTGFTFVLLVLFQGCNWNVPKDPYTLAQNIPSDPETLNPVLATTAYSNSVYGQIYEQLFDLDNVTLKPKPKLAERWEIAPDHLHYTFYLRKDVKWHDGKPFTVDDVLYTYQKIMDPKVDAAPIRNYFKDVLKAEKLDQYTVRFTYRQPYEGALTTIGLMFAIPKHIFDDGQDFNSHKNNRIPVGTGPFQFVEWKTGNSISLKRFDRYWKPEYKIREMVFKIIPDSLTAFQLFKKGDLDLIDLNPLQWARQSESKKFLKRFVKHKLLTPYSSTYSYIGWNLKRPYFQDKRVRLALAHLLDKNLVNQKLLFGLYYTVTGPYYPFGNKYDKELKPIEYNLSKAKKLLDDAGWRVDPKDGIRKKNGVPFKFTLLFASGTQFGEQLTPILQSNFSQVGIDVELSRVEGITMFQRVHEHDFDAYLAAWGRGVGEDLYQIWHSSQIDGGSNYVSYSNPEVDHLLEAARQEFDETKQALICQKIHKILYEDQPYLFLFARPDLIARDGRFKNVKEYPAGLDMKEWTIEE